MKWFTQCYMKCMNNIQYRNQGTYEIHKRHTRKCIQYTHTHMHTHAHIYTHAHARTHTYVHTCTHTHTCKHTHIPTCAHTHMHTNTQTSLFRDAQIHKHTQEQNATVGEHVRRAVWSTRHELAYNVLAIRVGLQISRTSARQLGNRAVH